ncbi:hypothetical protein [Halobacteriovorax marinus]|uniref:hypothetical protein n=1 Tax=Halobacteriovorax marinus TaxID=97084 RepID=UPI003A9040E0
MFKYIFLMVILCSQQAWSMDSADHDHGHDHGVETHKKEKGGHDHSDEHDDEHDDEHGSEHSDGEHGHEDEGHDHGHGHGHGGGKSIGEGKAISEVDEKRGFRLSPEAFTTLGIKLETYSGESQIKISKKILVKSKEERGIYIMRDKFFKLYPVSIVKEFPEQYLVKVKGLKEKDQIVTSGVKLLRVSDIYSTDKSEYGHAH